MLTPTDIAEYGERNVEKWLTDNGYRCHHQTQRHGTKDLEGRSADNEMLVHVISHLASNPANGCLDVPSACLSWGGHW